jgi:SAM-dependent methyltransferase
MENTEKTENPEWFKDIHFWELYGPIMFDRKRWDEVPQVADAVARLGKLAPGGKAHVLDLCCGFGRIALELSRRGFAVTGVDITETYLVTGQDDADYEELDVEFILQDVRAFKRPGFFDLAVNLYISFGYFADQRDDLLFAKNACESLKEGGSFIIETLGKEIAVRDFVEAEWFERAGYTVLTEYEPVDSWAGLRNRWIIIKDGKRMEKNFVQRLYSAAELRQLLFDAGFKAVEIYGGWNDEPYDHRAEVLIAVGRK